MMNILFCNDPMNPKTVDSMFESEFNSCVKNGFNVEFINFEEIINKNIPKSVKKIIRYENPKTTVYRGWMLNEFDYSSLYYKLLELNHKLINDPTQYLLCQYMPYNYKFIEEFTPRTVWIDLDDKNEYNILEVMKKLEVFEGRPLILKDYVKSQKHKWKEACFIEDSSSISNVKKTVDTFIELQAESITKGLVFREFIEFDFLSLHSKSKMPLTKEFRLFFFKNELAAVMKYWDEGEYEDESIEDINVFKALAKKIDSNFFSMDVARSKSGRWYIVELGDGQVTGFPNNFNPELLYNRIKSLY